MLGTNHTACEHSSTQAAGGSRQALPPLVTHGPDHTQSHLHPRLPWGCQAGSSSCYMTSEDLTGYGSLTWGPLSHCPPLGTHRRSWCAERLILAPPGESPLSCSSSDCILSLPISSNRGCPLPPSFVHASFWKLTTLLSLLFPTVALLRNSTSFSLWCVSFCTDVRPLWGPPVYKQQF